MFRNRLSPSKVASQRSSALIIALAVLVLISAILLIFFDQSTLNREISFSSAGQSRAEMIARTALDTVVGDLRTEIAAGSTVSTANGVSLYLPSTNFTVAPNRVFDQGFPNLVKQSASTSNFWTGAYYNASMISPVRAAANNSTVTASANGRFIRLNEWNEIGLLGDPTAATTPQVPAGYVPPDWILVTRAGPATNAATLPSVGPGTGTLSDKTAGNVNFVVGRYAYTVYDEGGLLDVNVAGFPSSVSGSAFTSRRGLLPQIDLASIPGIDSSANANALVQWRNGASAASAATYTNYVFGANNGFMTVAAGDQAFVSRRDLIDYVLANPGQISTSALPYLGTFTRELNAPSYTPPILGSASRPATSSGPITGADDTFNPSLINTRVTTPIASRTSDGLPASVGEPLLKYRFPLSRLGLISYQGNPSAAVAAQILQWFGLTWSTSIMDEWSKQTTSGWVYNHGDATKILNLSQVAALGREPDFFELLQAGILLGSLGKQFAPEISVTYNYDFNDYYQILQIGANLIDQSDTDSYPTLINFNGHDFYGVESLPYIADVASRAYRELSGGSPTPTIGTWDQPILWNPHLATPATGPAPTNFRFIDTGSSAGLFSDAATPPATFTTPVVNLAGSWLAFSGSFPNPTMLSPPTATATGPNTHVTDGNADFIGICTGIAANLPDIRMSPNNYGSTHQWSTATVLPKSNQGTTPSSYTYSVNHELQYQDPSGNWVTYDVVRNVTSFVIQHDDVYPTVMFTTYDPDYPVMFIRSDPRTDRFGGLQTFLKPDPVLHQTPRIDAGQGFSSFGGNSPYMIQIMTVAPYGTGWHYTPGPVGSAILFYPGLLADNRAAGANGYLTYYDDGDGVTRPGDGAYVDGTLSDGGYPLATDAFNQANSRPVMLNRPFRSVGEMAYASRGMPWKSLDFFTSQSADSALLDLFCVYEPTRPTGTATQAVEAGRLDLNTRQLPVLAAALTGAVKSEASNATINSTEANNLASTLTNLTQDATKGPLLSRSELVTRYAGLLNGPANGYANLYDSKIKANREASIRALSDIGNTRTWNLLIDVIAQSGRYSPVAVNLNQFTVEGQRHYWLHVAIDRYTGRVIDQLVEPVNH